MSTRTQAGWTVSGMVAAPVAQVWAVLLASTPLLSPADKQAAARAAGPEPFIAACAQPGGGRVEVDPRRHRLAVQGEWWYRGEYTVEPHPRGSLVVYRVYNIAPGAGWWAAQLVQGPGHARTMRRHLHDLLQGIGDHLRCESSLLAA
jgi:hypothetical protein